MFKLTSIFLTLTAALELVLASSVSITSPSPDTVWEAGSTVEIKWKVNEASTGPIRIQYASGPSQALVVNGLIVDNVTASAGQFKWKIPSDIKTKKYVIEAGPSPKDLSFAGYVHIKGKKKGTTTTKKTGKKTTTKKVGKKTSTKKTTKKSKTTVSGKKPSAVCVGYPTRGEGQENVRCHSIPKPNKKHVSSPKKKSTTKKHTTKKHTTKKASVV